MRVRKAFKRDCLLNSTFGMGPSCPQQVLDDQRVMVVQSIAEAALVSEAGPMQWSVTRLAAANVDAFSPCHAKPDGAPARRQHYAVRLHVPLAFDQHLVQIFEPLQGTAPVSPD
jgi:hypothetical protein